MSLPAHAPQGARDVSWTEEDWARALDARPDLLARLNAGDVNVLAEILELQPGVTARPVDRRS